MKTLNPHCVWLGIFGVWIFFLTGALSGVFGGTLGGPGAMQAIRLQNLLHAKSVHLENIQIQVNGLQAEAELLEKSPAVQQREIRRVLGYAAPDEIIFDFSTGEEFSARAPGSGLLERMSGRPGHATAMSL